MRFLIPFLFATSAYSAEFTCNMTSECVDLEGCQDTAFALSFAVGPDNFPAAQDANEPPHIIPVTVTTDAETLNAQPIYAPEAAIHGFWGSDTSGTQHLMTVGSDRVARYSVHMPNFETAVFYTGTCEEN